MKMKKLICAIWGHKPASWETKFYYGTKCVRCGAMMFRYKKGILYMLQKLGEKSLQSARMMLPRDTGNLKRGILRMLPEEIGPKRMRVKFKRMKTN